MPVGNIPSAGYDPELVALLTVDVDTGPLEQGLGRARGRAAGALGQMERDAARFGRRTSFVFQNVGYQVSDFIVQVGSGTSAFRAFAQQAPQAVQAFAILGGTVGRISIPLTLAITLATALAAAFFDTGSSAKTAQDKLKDLEGELGTLADRYRTAEGAARNFIAEQQHTATSEAGRNILEQETEAAEAYLETLSKIRVTGRAAFSGDAERIRAIINMTRAFESGALSATEFREQISAFASQSGTGAGQVLRSLAGEAIEARDKLNDLRQESADLSTGFQPEKIEALRKKIADLKNEVVVASLPERFRAAAKAAADMGADLSRGERGLIDLTSQVGSLSQQLAQAQFRDKLRDLTNQVAIAKLPPDLRDAAKAAQELGYALDEVKPEVVTELSERAGELDRQLKAANYADTLMDLQNQIVTLQLPKQFEDAAKAAIALGIDLSSIVGSPEKLAEVLAETPDYMRALVNEADAAGIAFRDAQLDVKIRDLNEQLAIARLPENLRAAGQAALELGASLNAAGQVDFGSLSPEQMEKIKRFQELTTAGQRQGQINQASRLPDDIDAANVSASELSTTLTDVGNLSFGSLGAALANIGQQIAQAAIQALIFRTIMGGIGGLGAADAGATATPPPTAVGPGGLLGHARHGAVFARGRLATAQHGAVFRRGEMALMTGRVSGAALLEGAGDEAAVPLVTLPSGKLGVGTGGGGGGGSVFNIDARGATPGMQAMIENGVRRALAAAPAYSANAYSRGIVRDERRPPF